MPASWPTSVKTFTSRTDTTDVIYAAHVNDLQDEVNAIETSLGVGVKGGQTDVNTRIGLLESGKAATSHTHDHGTGLTGLADDDHPQYLLKAGGTMTGDSNFADFTIQRPLLRDWAETLSVIATSTGTRDLDYTVANVWDVTLSAACTFTFSNWPASGRSGTLTLILRNGGTAYAATWPAAVKWAGGTAPTLSGINKADIITFVSLNGGTTVAGTLIQDFASL